MDSLVKRSIERRARACRWIKPTGNKTQGRGGEGVCQAERERCGTSIVQGERVGDTLFHRVHELAAAHAVVKNAETATHNPRAVFDGLPGKSDPRREIVLRNAVLAREIGSKDGNARRWRRIVIGKVVRYYVTDQTSPGGGRCRGRCHSLHQAGPNVGKVAVMIA